MLTNLYIFFQSGFSQAQTIGGKVNIFASFRNLAGLCIIDSDTFRVHAFGDPSYVLLYRLKVSLAAPYIFSNCLLPQPWRPFLLLLRFSFTCAGVRGV